MTRSIARKSALTYAHSTAAARKASAAEGEVSTASWRARVMVGDKGRIAAIRTDGMLMGCYLTGGQVRNNLPGSAGQETGRPGT